VATVNSSGLVTARAAGLANVIATVDGVQGTAVVAVPQQSAGTASGSTSLWTNRPQGFTTITDQPWHALPGAGINSWGWNESANLTIVPISDSPVSPVQGSRIRVREGSDGVGPFNTWYSFPDEHRGFSELYFAAWYKIPSDWVNHRVGTKQFWPLPDNHNNSPVTRFTGRDMRITAHLQGEPWGNRNLDPNVGPDSHWFLNNWRDQWVRVEYYFKINTVNSRDGDVKRADGIIRAWLTAGGQTHQILDHSDVKFFETDGSGNYTGKNGQPSTGKFRSFRWNPTYGGIGDPAPRDMIYFVDHIQVSGR
jgi:hypothetical protein